MFFLSLLASLEFLFIPSTAQFQRPLPYSALPCDLNYNTTSYSDYLRVKALDLAGSELNTSGVFRKADNYNGYPVYRKEFLYKQILKPRMIFLVRKKVEVS